MNFAAIPTLYEGVRFRSRLEARWAAFFDLMGWKWEYEPIDFNGWIPDFKVEFSCWKRDCDPHCFYAEVKPFWSLEEFDGHPANYDDFGVNYGLDGCLVLGLNPEVARVVFAHNSSGGEYQGWNIFRFYLEGDVSLAWKKAGNRTQWRPR